MRAWNKPHLAVLTRSNPTCFVRAARGERPAPAESLFPAAKLGVSGPLSLSLLIWKLGVIIPRYNVTGRSR